MFEKHHEKKLAETYQHDLAQWQQLHDDTVHMIELARSYSGAPSSDLMLHGGEAVYGYVTGASLIEDRRGRGHYVGGSAGISIPVATIGGHAVRYHLGATRGHYEQAPPVPTAIDQGTVFVTNQRVVFKGARQTRECLFSKLIGVEHEDDGTTIVSVSNRQKPTVVHYGAKLAGWFQFRLALALAHAKGAVAELEQQLDDQLRQIESGRPQPPTEPG